MNYDYLAEIRGIAGMVGMWDEEAIEERNPRYTLPCQAESTCEEMVPFTLEDMNCWKRMCMVRPILACLMG